MSNVVQTSEQGSGTKSLRPPGKGSTKSRGRVVWIVISLVALVLIVIGVNRMRSGQPAGKLITGQVQRGDLTETVTATGSVNAQTGAEVHIGSQITGVIKKLNADIGTTVKAGQVIAELDLPDLQAQLASSKAALAQAQLKYAQEVSGVGLTDTTTASGITQAQQAALSAKEKLNVAKSNLNQQSVTTPSDIRKAQSQLEVARAGLTSAQSNLKVVQFNSNLTVVNAQEQLTQAKANATYSATSEQRERNLVAQGFAAKADYDNAHALSMVNASQVRAADKNVTLTTQKVQLDIATAQDQVSQARQAVVAAEASLQAALAETHLVSARSADVRDALTAIKQADAAMKLADASRANNTIKSQNVRVAADAVRQAEAAVAYQQAQANKAFIRSPITGTVLQLTAQQGETLAAGLSAPTVIVVADLKRLQVDAYVDETDIGKVKLGQKVNISVDAFPDRTFVGKVQKIASGSTIQQSVVTYDVTVAITDPDHILKPDMTANVTIETGKITDVLLIPAVAVQAGSRGSTVNVVKMTDGKQTIVPTKVVTGGTDGVNVEIKSGLKETDKIVLAGATTPSTRSANGSNPFGPAPRTGGGGGGGGR